MQWRRLGLAFKVSEAGLPWMHSHAQLPVADHVSGDVFKVYFATRTREQISRVGWAMVELGDRTRLLEVGSWPVLEPGPIGTFDEHGVFPSCIVSLAGRKRMYYIGWNRGYRAPMFYASIGLAESADGGETWTKMSRAPVMARAEHDPCLVTSPHVLRHGGVYRMTYVSGVRWAEEEGQLKSYYHIKYAESEDGTSWRRDGRVAVDFAATDETNIARSFVVHDAGRLHMWFCYVRGAPYRIGYARSGDYLSWEREDAAGGLGPSTQGWDSEMVCYPNVVVHGGQVYMFYNGNSFGRDGFGIAVRDSLPNSYGR